MENTTTQSVRGRGFSVYDAAWQLASKLGIDFETAHDLLYDQRYADMTDISYILEHLSLASTQHENVAQSN